MEHEPAFKWNMGNNTRIEQEFMEYMGQIEEENPPKLYVWFEEKPAGTWFCLEFHGGYQVNAPWYAPFWRRLRMELGSKDPTASVGWSQGGGGMAGKVWRLNLASESLRSPQNAQNAYYAVTETVKAFNGYPHRVGIVLETI